MGFAWQVCVHALSSTSGNVEQAAEALFGMEDSEGIVTAWEVRCTMGEHKGRCTFLWVMSTDRVPWSLLQLRVFLNAATHATFHRISRRGGWGEHH